MIRYLSMALMLILSLLSPVEAREQLISTATTPDGVPVPYILDSISGTPRYVLILFPGGNDIVNPRMENDRLTYEKKGNFLLRAREFWVDDDFVTVTTNSTSSESLFTALLSDLQQRFPAARIYLIGTSRGTYNTMQLSGFLSDKIAGVIHTSSLSNIAWFDTRKFSNRHLIVHHEQDYCRVTPFTAAEAAHQRYGTALIVMSGGKSVGDSCEAFAYHGYNGIEAETVAAIKHWIHQQN